MKKIIASIILAGFVSGIARTAQAVAYTSTQNGEWDNVVTWGGGGFPASGDTALIDDGHTVTMKGDEACSNVTVAADGGSGGGVLQFDGQASGTATRAQLTLDNGATMVNNGTVNATDTDATGYASLVGASLEAFTGTAPSLGAHYWHFSQIDFQMGITTGGGGCTIEIDGTCEFDAVTVSANDTLDGNASTLRVGGNWTVSGTFTYGTSTLQFIASSSAWFGDKNYYDVTVDNGVTTTFRGSMYLVHTLTINGALSVAVGLHDIWIMGTGRDIVGNVSNGAIAPTVHYFINADFNVADSKYWRFNIQSNKADPTSVTLDGDITVYENFYVNNAPVAGSYLHLNTAGHNITAMSTSYFGLDNRYAVSVTCGSSIIDLNSTVNIPCTNSYLVMDSSTWRVKETWSCGSTNSASWDEGASTFEIDGNAAQTITSGSMPFYNLTVKNTHATSEVKFSGAINVTHDLSIDNGIMNTQNNDLTVTDNVVITDTLLGNASTITCGGNWTNSGTFTCITSTNIFTGVANVDNNNQAFYSLISDAGAGTVTLVKGTVSAISNLFWIKSGICHTDDKVDKQPMGAGTWARISGGINTIACGVSPQIEAGARLETGDSPARTVFYMF